MITKYRTLAVIAGLFLLGAGSLFAQTPRELRFGTWVSGNLGEGEEQWFSVRAAGAGFVVVETEGDLDTILEAYDASHTLIGANDDGGEDYNARLEIYAEAGNIYLFKLSCYDDDDDDGESRPYRIRASFDSIPPDAERNTEHTRAVSINLGEEVPVYLRSPSESRWYYYDISRAGTLLVVQTRGNMDTLLALFDDRGNLIEENDDSGDDANALISERLGPGTVYIEVKEYGGGMGRCTLHAETR